MIESGVKTEKTEEYREIKPYWEKRLIDYKALVKYYEENRKELTFKQVLFPYRPLIENVCGAFPRGFEAVRFHYGYTKRTMLFQCLGISIGNGKKEWGAPDSQVFIISLGKRLKEGKV